MLEVDEASLKSARGNYETKFYLEREELDGTYTYILRFTNKNKKIPLYIHDIVLQHRRMDERIDA